MTLVSGMCFTPSMSRWQMKLRRAMNLCRSQAQASPWSEALGSAHLGHSRLVGGANVLLATLTANSKHGIRRYSPVGATCSHLLPNDEQLSIIWETLMEATLGVDRVPILRTGGAPATELGCLAVVTRGRAVGR